MNVYRVTVAESQVAHAFNSYLVVAKTAASAMQKAEQYTKKRGFPMVAVEVARVEGEFLS